jgi:putative peptidoglycan lipid II flippase
VTGTEPGAPGRTESSASHGGPPDDPTPAEHDTGRASFFVAAGILVSRLSGLVREAAMGAFLALSPAGDAFHAALRIPQLLQNLLGEGVLSAAFIPVYAQLLEDGDEEEAGRVAGAIAGLLTAVTGLLVAAAIVAAPLLTSILAPGFEGETYDLTVRLVQIMTGGLGFMVLSAWCLGVLNTHRRFFLSYAAPVIWNATQVAVLIFVGLKGWTEADIAVAVAWAVTIGGALQFLIQLPLVRRVAPRIWLSVRTDLPGVRTVLRRFGPAVMGRGVVQIGAFIDLALASLLATGAVAALSYAQILYLLPVSLFAMSIAAAELPELSRSAQEPGVIRRRLTVGLGRIAFFMAFTTAAYLVAGHLIVAAIYERRLFDADDTTLVWAILGGYALGLAGIGASRLVQNVLFALGDVAGPARIAAVRVALAAGFGVILMFQLDRVIIEAGSLQGLGELPAPLRALPSTLREGADLSLRLGAVGLALGSSIASWVELGLLGRRLQGRLDVEVSVWRPIGRFVVPAIVSAVVMVGVQLGLPELSPLIEAPLVIGLGGLVYLGVARLQGAPEVALVTAPLTRLRR